MSSHYLEETINFVEQIHIHKKFSLICAKLIFRKLFKFNSRLFKLADVCTMGGQLYVTFSNIYKIKVKKNVVAPSKVVLNQRFADDICNRLNITLSKINNKNK